MSNEILKKCRDRQFNILCGIKELCDREGIRMMLLGDAAFAAYRGDFVTDNITVCIDAADIRKFMEAFDKNSGGLVMDSMYTNPDFPLFEIRVYDPETIDFTISDFKKYRYNCLFVRVVFVLHQPGMRIRRAGLNSLKGAYTIRNKVYFGERIESASRMVRILEKQEKKKGREQTAKWAFSKLVKGYASDSDKLLIDDVPFSKKVLGKGREVEVNGVKFLIPEQAKQYFGKVFGKKWQEHQPEPYVEDIRRFRDADHSWEEFRERVSYMDFDGYYRDLKEFYERSRTFNEYHKSINKYRDILTRTDMRFKLWQKYMPMKDEIVSMHEKGDYDALAKVLKEYMYDMELCEEKELGLCFDEDILNITLDVYRHHGDAEHAEALNKLVPPEHREVLHIMDYKGDIIA